MQKFLLDIANFLGPKSISLCQSAGMAALAAQKATYCCLYRK